MGIITKTNEKLLDSDLKTIMNFPKKNLLLEVTNSCNNQCIFCANRIMTRNKKNINPKLPYKVIEEAYKLGTREIGFYATGEPLLNPNLIDYIKKAKDIGYNYIYLTTNGILADKEKVLELYKAGLNSIKFSINAINENDYLLIHKTNNYNRVFNNLKNIYSEKTKLNLDLRVYVSYIMTKFSEYSLSDIKNHFKNISDEVIVQAVRNQGGMLPEIEDKLIPISQNSDISQNHYLPCRYPFNSITVTCEGYLTACCMDFQNYLAYADLKEESLNIAWNNKYIRSIRKKHLECEVDNTLCENCVYNTKTIPKPIREDLCTNFKTEFFTDDTINKLSKEIEFNGLL